MEEIEIEKEVGLIFTEGNWLKRKCLIDPKFIVIMEFFEPEGCNEYDTVLVSLKGSIHEEWNWPLLKPEMISYIHVTSTCFSKTLPLILQRRV